MEKVYHEKKKKIIILVFLRVYFYKYLPWMKTLYVFPHSFFKLKWILTICIVGNL